MSDKKQIADSIKYTAAQIARQRGISLRDAEKMVRDIVLRNENRKQR